VTEVHEEAVVGSAFNVPTAMYVSAMPMRMAAVLAAKMPDDVVNAETLNNVVQTEG
jgi:hypothetical protein